MNAYGIRFEHRRPTAHEYVSQDFARFMAFAALCDSRGVAVYVHRVFFDHNAMGFDIELAGGHEYTPIAQRIWECAEDTLPQFFLFGTCGHQREKA